MTTATPQRSLNLPTSPAPAADEPAAQPPADSTAAASTAFTLTPDEWEKISLLAQDTTLAKAVQVRAHALLLMRDHVEETIIANRTGLAPAAQRALRKEQRAYGIDSVFNHGTRRTRTSKFPIAVIVEALRQSLKSRPPEGSTRWDLRKLTTVIRESVPAAARISSESVRTILRKELGIDSIRQVEPFWLAQIKRSHRHHASH